MFSQFKNQKTYIDQTIRNLQQSAVNHSLSTTSITQLPNRIFKQQQPKLLKRNEDKFATLNRWEGETELQGYTDRGVQNDSSDEDLDLINPDVINPFILDLPRSDEKVEFIFREMQPIDLYSDEDSFEQIEMPAKLDLDLYD